MKRIVGTLIVVICAGALSIAPSQARSIVDTGGGGGTSLSWRDAGDERPGPRWAGGVLFY